MSGDTFSTLRRLTSAPLSMSSLTRSALPLRVKMYERGIALAVARIDRGAFVQHAAEVGDVVVARSDQELRVQAQLGLRLGLCICSAMHRLAGQLRQRNKNKTGK